ncbi:MAG: DUF481 domain-containing protein [Pseudomonadota bacterium]
MLGLLLAVAASADEPYPVPLDAQPPEDGADWVQLTSGEWLRGELISLFEDKLTFDSDILEEVSIDAEDIAQFISSRTFAISVHGSEPKSGVVYVGEGRVQINTANGTLDIPPADLVAITVAAERELDRWDIEASLGATIRSGNTNFSESFVRARAVRRTPVTRTVSEYLGTYNDTEGEVVTNNHRLNLTIDQFSGGQFFWRPLISQYFKDPLQNIDHQVTMETGAGFHLVDTSRTEWDIYSSVGVNWLRRVSVEGEESRDTTSPALSFGTDFETEVTDWMDYVFNFQMTFLDEDSGEYQHHLVTSLSTDLIGDLDLDISFIWDRTQSPTSDADGIVPEKDDFRLVVGVGIEF